VGTFLFTPSLGVAVPVRAFSERNPIGLAFGLGFDLAVTRGNHLGIHYGMQRYDLDAGVTEWIASVALHDKLFVGESGFFVDAGIGLYIDERTGNQAVVPLRPTQGGIAATPAAEDNLAAGINAGLGWQLPGRNLALVAGYYTLFDQRVHGREGLGRTQCLVLGLQTALRVP
jgi:hypothetical protein